MRFSKFFFLAGFVFLFSPFLKAQSDHQDNFLKSGVSQFYFNPDSSVSAVQRISISNLEDVDINEVPGSVVLLNREDIQRSGARDIMELLNTVPGFAFGMDVDDVTGLSIRGLWAHEGKFLIMINGIVLNESDFGTYAFQHRLNLQNVDRVEIIQGPGSVIYGGTAQLGVINIITNEPGQRDGAFVESWYAGTPKANVRNGVSLFGSHYVGNETFLSYSTSFNKGEKSGWNTTNSFGNRVNFADSTAVDNIEVLVKLQRKKISFQYYYNNYSFQVVDAPYSVQKTTNTIDAKYDSKWGLRSNVSLRANYTYQLPWTYKNTVDPDRVASNTKSDRIFLSGYINTSFGSKFKTLVGAQLYRQRNIAELNGDFSALNWRDVAKASPNLLSGVSAFFDATYRLKGIVLSAGVRSELTNQVPAQLAPRFGATTKIKQMVLKFSHAYSYKIPTIQNILLGPQDGRIRTEVSQTTEFSIKYQKTERFEIGSQFFRTIIRFPIVYVSDSSVLDSYINRDIIGTQGFEAFLKWKEKKWSSQVSVSYYRLEEQSKGLPEVELEGQNVAQGIPQSKWVWSTWWAVNKNIQWGNVLIHNRNLQAFQGADMDEDFPQPTRFSNLWLINSFFDFSFKNRPNVQLRVGVNNVLNQKYFLASPYNSGVEAMPVQARELSLRFTYQLTQ